jgi:hypothetical protein
MAKSTRKKVKEAKMEKEAKGMKRTQKTAKGQTKAGEYTDCLLELHKLQGTLLTRLRKEV